MDSSPPFGASAKLRCYVAKASRAIFPWVAAQVRRVFAEVLLVEHWLRVHKFQGCPGSSSEGFSVLCDCSSTAQAPIMLRSSIADPATKAKVVVWVPVDLWVGNVLGEGGGRTNIHSGSRPTRNDQLYQTQQRDHTA